MKPLVRSLGTAALGMALLFPAAGQVGGGGSLTNQDIITLAGAGFSESFLLDAIMSSQSRFDTNAAALVELTKHAVSERIIRAMVSHNTPVEALAMPADAGAVLMPSPNGPERPRQDRGRPVILSPTVLAVQSGTPYYEWKSLFWGLWRKRVGIAATPARPGVQQRLDPVYREMRPQTQYVRSSPFEPMTYYLVAPR